MTRLVLLLPVLMSFIPALAFCHPGASSTVDHYTHEIALRPDDQALHIRRGIAYSSDGQYDLALADFKRAEKLGNPIAVGFDLGVLYYRRGELDLARAQFDTYLEAFRDHAPCLEYRARLLRDMGDTKGSVADFKRVFELQQRPNPGHYVSVAGMLEATGPEGIDQALLILDSGNAKLGITPPVATVCDTTGIGAEAPRSGDYTPADTRTDAGRVPGLEGRHGRTAAEDRRC